MYFISGESSYYNEERRNTNTKEQVKAEDQET